MHKPQRYNIYRRDNSELVAENVITSADWNANLVYVPVKEKGVTL